MQHQQSPIVVDQRPDVYMQCPFQDIFRFELVLPWQKIQQAVCAIAKPPLHVPEFEARAWDLVEIENCILLPIDTWWEKKEEALSTLYISSCSIFFWSSDLNQLFSSACCLMVASAASMAFMTWNKLSSLLLILAMHVGIHRRRKKKGHAPRPSWERTNYGPFVQLGQTRPRWLVLGLLLA